VSVRAALLSDLTFIDGLRRSNSEAVGFVPLSGYRDELEGRRNGRILIVEDNAEQVGFAYTTFGAGLLRMAQVVVREDARRRERATALVDAAIDVGLRRGAREIACRVAADLDAMDFWKAVGFTFLRRTQGGNRRGRELAVFRRPISPRLVSDSEALS
jgi:GNAT superfamily N-acetyltransferase